MWDFAFFAHISFNIFISMDDLIDEDVADVIFETPCEKGKRPGTILRPPPEKKLKSLLVRLPEPSDI